MLQPDLGSWESVQKIAKGIARKLSQRASKLGIMVSTEDIEQELAITWCRCREAIDPDRMQEFPGYFATSCWNSWVAIQKQYMDKVTDHAIRLDDQIVDGEGGSIIDLIEDESCIDPETSLIQRDIVNILKDKTAVLGGLIKLQQTNPPEFQEELDALRAQYDYAQSIGIKMEQPPTELTPKMISRILGLPFYYNTDLNSEIEYGVSKLGG